MRTRTGGIVLCGGRSSRMGRPKAWLPVGDEVLLQRVVRVVAEVVSPIVVVAAPGQQLPALPAGVEVVRDAAEGNGPLEGLAAGLAALHTPADAAFAVGCDSPFLSAAFVARLVELRGAKDVCVPVVGGFPRPLPGVYAVGVLGVVRELLVARSYRLGRLLEVVPTRLVPPADLSDADPGLRSLVNVNTPADYARALAEAETG